MPGLTETLAQRTAGLRLTDVPENARRVAAQCLLDWIGVAIAAQDEPLVRILIDDALEDVSEGSASIIATGLRLPPPLAARLNGAMGHALDYDDVIFMGHPTAPVAPAVLAAAEQRGASGADILTAFIAGFEAECRVSRYVGPSHYAKGWHSTGTLGTFGAAAGAGRLMGLAPAQLRHAFGLAAAQASGLKSMFGTMTKPFHAGHAAEGGLMAARLAARGYTANPDALETSQGFGDTQSVAPDLDAALTDPPGGFYVPDTLFKYHAACYLTHSSIEAASALRRTHNLDLASIERVIVEVDPGHLKVCDIAAPQTGLECKFSLTMTTALALSGEATSDEALFTDATAARRDLVALRDRVAVMPSSKGTLSRVTLRLADGAERSEAIDVAVPDRDLEAQQARLERKFRALVTPRLGASRTESLIEAIASLHSTDDKTSFFSLLRGDTRQA